MRASQFAALILSFAGALGVHAKPVTLTDDLGQTHTFTQSPSRIISLLPSLTESVCALGACARLVGVDRFSTWPESVRALPKLGGLTDPLLEPMVALNPDVVLLDPSSRVRERLSALGLSVIVLDTQTHADVPRVLGLIGRLLEREHAVAPLLASIEADVARAAARVPPKLRGKRVYFEVSSEPYAAGEASFIGATIARLGLGNIVPAAMGPFPKLNPEFVLAAQPDLVLTSARELPQLATRPGWSTLTALKHASCGFEVQQSDVLVRPGPRLGEAAALLADCFERIGAP
jgi:iron complex transport system substrate-binding protein